MSLPAAALVYATITALLFRDLLPRAATHLYSDLGDPLLNTSILAWNAARRPLTEAWWHFPAFAPLSGVTSFTEHLLLAYPIASPVIWATGNPVLAYNVVFLLALPLNGLAAYALAREVTGSRAGAFVGGLAYAFAPYQSVHLSHLQHMLSFGMPFALLWLHRYLATGRRTALVWFGAGWLMTAAANSALLVFVPLFVALWSIWFVRTDWRRLAGPAVAAGLASLPLLPLLWGYRVQHAAHGVARSYDEVRSFSADVVGLLGMYHRAVPWRGLLPHDFEEGALFPGFTTAALAVAAVAGVVRGAPLGDWPRRCVTAFAALTLVVLARIWTGPWGWHLGPLPLPPFRPYRLFTLAVLVLIAGVIWSSAFRRAWARRDLVVFYAAAAVVLWLTALGPEPEWSTPWRALSVGPYTLLFHLPGMDTIRVPARAWFPAALCLAILAAFGAARITTRLGRRAGPGLALVAALVVAEGWFTDRSVAAPAPMPSGAIPAGATVLDLPMEEGFHNAVPQHRAVMGGYRTVNGYSGYLPPHFTPLRRAIADLAPDTLEPYRRHDDLYVIVRPDTPSHVARWIADQPGAVFLSEVDAGARVRVFRLPRLPRAAARAARPGGA